METRPSVVRACDPLRPLYRQWQSLTRAEGDAIRRRAWPMLVRLHEAKRSLQEAIARAIREWEAGHASDGIGRQPLEREFGGLVQDLIELESRNLESLGEQLQQAKARQAELESSAANLRLIRDAYGDSRPSVWHSYS